MRNACSKEQFSGKRHRKSSKIRKLRKFSLNTSKRYAYTIRHVRSIRR
jgi:hypothetical protein